MKHLGIPTLGLGIIQLHELVGEIGYKSNNGNFTQYIFSANIWKHHFRHASLKENLHKVLKISVYNDTLGQNNFSDNSKKYFEYMKENL